MVACGIRADVRSTQQRMWNRYRFVGVAFHFIEKPYGVSMSFIALPIY